MYMKGEWSVSQGLESCTATFLPPRQALLLRTAGKQANAEGFLLGGRGSSGCTWAQSGHPSVPADKGATPPGAKRTLTPQASTEHTPLPTCFFLTGTASGSSCSKLNNNPLTSSPRKWALQRLRTIMNHKSLQKKYLQNTSCNYI